MFEKIFSEFGFEASVASVQPFGSGLINNTWLVAHQQKDYILQRINQHVFKKPFDIAENSKVICEYVKENFPDYNFICPCKTASKDEMIFVKDHGYFRMFPFVKNSHTIDVVNTLAQANEAATQFGKFTAVLSGFPVEKIKITIPNFHDLTLRYQQFEAALQNGNKKRIKATAAIIDFLKSQYDIVTTSEKIGKSKDFKKRVTHHDCKISNVLFDENDKGICVIDLDTVMPGYFISDVGDMMRTYLSPYSEEEKEVSKVDIREDYFKAIAEGYLSEMGNELSQVEKDHFVYAGKFMTYMQAIRFLTDYLNDDIYYIAKYEGHNFTRANNQVTLLKKIIEKEKLLQKIINIV
jgi:Ser/Thr protein kinase RdoA (MazF antagonist)